MKKLFFLSVLASLWIHAPQTTYAMQASDSSWEKIILSPHKPDSADLEIEKAEEAMIPRQDIKEVSVYPSGIEFYSPNNSEEIFPSISLDGCIYTNNKAQVNIEELAPILKLFFEKTQQEDFNPRIEKSQNPLAEKIEKLLDANNNEYFEQGIGHGCDLAWRNRSFIERHPRRIIVGSFLVGLTAGIGAMYLSNKH